MSVNELSGRTEQTLNMGDAQTFDDLFRAYYAPLCYYTEKIVADKETAEDLISSLFVRLWDTGRVFDSLTHFRAFLYRSAHNASLDYLKTNKRENDRYNYLLAMGADSEESHLNSMVRSEVWAEIMRAIDGLPSQCGKVIRMSYIEGKKNEEIAVEMGVSLQAVKNYKGRALKELRQTLSGSSLLLLICHPWFH